MAKSPNPIIVGISGASGAVLARRTIDQLLLRQVPTIAVCSNGGKLVWQEELGVSFNDTRSEWRDSVRVKVSDPSRTLTDILDDPSIGGGIRHVASVLVSYFESEHRDEKRLVEYAKKLGNRTVFKRLGYLLELYDVAAPETTHACRRMLSSGLSPLDPSVRAKGKVIKRWNLRANVSLSPGDLA